VREEPERESDDVLGRSDEDGRATDGEERRDELEEELIRSDGRVTELLEA